MVGLLVIDINSTTSFRIKKLVEHSNTEVTMANNMMEALNRVNSIDQKIDMVVIDVQLGSEDGFELIKRIRASRDEIVICIVTSLNTRKAFVNSIKVGATDYIIKPFEDDYLRNKLIYHINAIEKSKAIPNQSPKEIDRAIFNAVKKAIRESYELMIGLFIIYHSDTDMTNDVSIKDNAILKSLNHYLKKHLSDDDEFYSFGSNGAVIIMPKHLSTQKFKIMNDYEQIINKFIAEFKIKDTFIAFDFLSLPNESNPKENVMTVLAKKIEEQLK